MADFIQGDYSYIILGDYSLRARAIDKTKTTYEDIPKNVTYQGTTYFVTDLDSCFYNCTSLTSAPIIPDSVIYMDDCFKGCTSLTSVPIIPVGVTYMSDCFYNCTSLASPPIIPDSVTNMAGCFSVCTSLTNPPMIPDGVIYISTCFGGCTSLTSAPIIPDSVTNMRMCFTDCTSLTSPPVIPDSVTYMADCFNGCTSLISAPIIPDSVTNIAGCFRGCTSLTGDIYILAPLLSDIAIRHCFDGTIAPIVLHAYNGGQALANTSNNHNVIVGENITPIVLNTQAIEGKRWRVEMLLGGENVGSITGMVPSGTLYDMDDNEIIFGIGANSAQSCSRCYAIFESNNQVPNASMNLTIQNVAPPSTYQRVAVGVPSTATPSQIKQEGESSLISARTDVGSVRFNPIGTGLDTYNVGALLNRFGVQASSNYTKTQTNLDNDIKHCVTHAQNVMIDSTTTLQDWITEQYNNLA